MDYPKELKYTTDHEWLRVETDFAYVGISFFAQKELGDIVFVEINQKIGDILNKDDIFGTIEAVKTVSDLFSPISGEIVEINHEIETNPVLLNDDCYDKGWLIKIKIKDNNEINSLLSDENYKELIGL